MDTYDLGTDLNGIMNLQRRLFGMERDLAAIKPKIDSLVNDSLRISQDHPEEKEIISQEIDQMNEAWNQLTELFRKRDAELQEAGDLQRFLRDLDIFQTWLTKTITDVAFEEYPSDLIRADKAMHEHQVIKEDIDNYSEDYTKMMQYGEQITSEDVISTDESQYMFLRERLKALKDYWTVLQQIWENKHKVLSDSLKLQLFLRDAKQADIILGQQEDYLDKDQITSSLENVEELIKSHEAFRAKMDASDEKINGIYQFAQKLLDEDHFDSDKIQKKSENIEERSQKNSEKLIQKIEKLSDRLKVHYFLQDCEELNNWIQEKHFTAQDESYRSAKTIYSKWTRHQAFEAEIASNKDRLFQIHRAGEELILERPEMRENITQIISELNLHFEELESITKENGEKLFDSNRQVLYEQTCDDIDSWVSDKEKQIEFVDTGNDLTTIKKLIQRLQSIEKQMAMKSKELDHLENQAQRLGGIVPDKTDAINSRRDDVISKFKSLHGPIDELIKQLLKKKEALQFRRDIEDEELWIKEKLHLALSTDYGNSLFTVHVLKKKLQSLNTEIENHEHRINNVCSNGQKLIDEGHHDSVEFKWLNEELLEEWSNLKKAMTLREQNLFVSEKVQQYLFDSEEAEDWMNTQELYMMEEDRGKDEISALNLMKKHQKLEVALDTYAETIHQLGETVEFLKNEGHADSEQFALRQSQIDRLYAILRDMARERRRKLDETLKLYMINREVKDLEQWIKEKEVVTNSSELGQDYEHVSMLRERFTHFASDTRSVGEERVAVVNDVTDQLISEGHPEAVSIAEWKDSINDAWADLQELIETRMQMLMASQDLHKYFFECREVLRLIVQKQNTMADELGNDCSSVSTFIRKHENFVLDLFMLNQQVEQIQEDSKKLQVAYAGNKVKEITNREEEVVSAWLNLKTICEERKIKLNDTSDLFKFFDMVRSLILWMDDIITQINVSEKARDDSSLELMIANHRDLNAEIVARDNEFHQCIAFGKKLLSRNHYASSEITEKLDAVSNKISVMLKRWGERWEYLKLKLEVREFERNASIVEQWLMSKEPYLALNEIGSSIDEVENLIKRHEELEKALVSQKDRFNLLEKITKFEEIELKRKKEKEEKQRKEQELQEELARQAAAELESSPQPESSATDGTDGPVNENSEHKLSKPTKEHIESSSDEDQSIHRSSPSKSHNETNKPKTEAEAKLISPTPVKDKQVTATLPAQSLSSSKRKEHTDLDEDQLEGHLTRKHVRESSSNKASNRSWNKLYTVLRGSRVMVYKDQPSSIATPKLFYKREPPIDVLKSTVTVADDYNKKRNVFRLKLVNGAEYLFQAKDDQEMMLWVESLKAASAGKGLAEPARSQTLPTSPNDTKPRSFFTMRRY